MRTMLCTLLLLFAPAVPAVPGSPAPPTVPVARSSHGIVYLGGNRLAPLDSYNTVMFRDGKPIANGYGFAPQPAPKIPPLTDDGAALSAASRIGPSVIGEGRSNSWSEDRILAEWQKRARRLPHIASVTVSGRTIEFVSDNGLHVIDMLPGPSAHAEVDRDSVDAQTVRDIQETLDGNGLVFIMPDAVFTFPQTDAVRFEAAVRKIRLGAPLNRDEFNVLDPVCNQFLRNPAALIRVP